MNKFMISGNVGFNPTKKDLDNGRFYCDVVIKCGNGRTNDEGKKQYDYITVRAWGKPAEFADKWLKEGQAIEVEGKLTSYFIEEEGGKKSRRISLEVDRFTFPPKTWDNNTSYTGYGNGGNQQQVKGYDANTGEPNFEADMMVPF